MTPVSSRSQRKLEAFATELVVLVAPKTIEARGAMGDVGLDLVELLEQVHGQDAFSEVSLVELRAEHRLVEGLELRERELRRQELEADRAVADLAAQSFERHRDDAFVIESERRELVDGKPRRVARIGCGMN